MSSRTFLVVLLFAIPLPSRAAPPNVCVAVFQDKSGSATENGVPQLSPDDLSPLLELLAERGGELGIGLVTDRSNRQLLRLDLEAEPARPAPPDTGGNPFRVANAAAAYRTTARRHDAAQAAHRTERQARAARYLREVGTLLGRTADAGRTDLFGAIARGEVFLGEPGCGVRYLVLISDGKDNVRRSPVGAPPAVANLVLVGAAMPSLLDGYRPSRFEGIGAAFRWIVSRERKNGPDH